MGYQALAEDSFSKEFVHQSGLLGGLNKPALELGCGFGLTARNAIKAGADLYCNDLESRHLLSLQEKLSDEERKRCHLIPGDMCELEIDEDKFSIILCSRVLHFFDGDVVDLVLKSMKRWLVSGGLLFIVVETPFLGNWKKFIPVYERNKKNNIMWPGFVDVASDFEDAGRSGNLPSFMHFFDLDTIAKALFKAGFSIEKISYIDRFESFPKDLLLDGRESLGAIAKKL